MFRRIVLTFGLGVLLVTGTLALPSPALASPRSSAEAAGQTHLAALTRSYFVALNRGVTTGSFSGLAAIIAPRAKLTERSLLSREAQVCCTKTVHGRSAIARFYRRLSAGLPGSRWVVGVMNQVSPATMVVYARRIGARGTPPLYSSHRVTIRNGTIVSLDLTLYLLQ
jgi:hypothetical protein